MRIYRISATQGNVSFTQSIKADSYKHPKAKFDIENNKDAHSFHCFSEDKAVIDKIIRRY